MNDLLMAAFICLAMNGELLQATEIKRKIIVREINGQTVVYDLENVESTTLKKSIKNQNIKIEIAVDRDSRNNLQRDNKPDSK